MDTIWENCLPRLVMATRRSLLTVVAILASWLAASPAMDGAPWVVPDWAGHEPTFMPGSLYWRTREYPNCPVLFRTVIHVGEKPVAFAAFEAKVSGFAYVFLNGSQVAAIEPKDAKGAKQIEVELAGHLN
jgi:hypothetical protein